MRKKGNYSRYTSSFIGIIIIFLYNSLLEVIELLLSVLDDSELKNVLNFNNFNDLGKITIESVRN